MSNTQTGSISFESTKGIHSYAKQNFSTLSQVLGQFATCKTGTSTANKVATIVPENSNWTLQEGTTVTVTFSSANTTTTPTLNVNNTGAKQIRDSEGNELTKAAREWAEGAAIALTYDGTYWRIQDSNLMERVHTAETEINQTATSITSLATLEDTYTKPDGTIGTNSIKSQFTQTANAINAKVDKNGVIASINASVEEENGSQIKISADKVNIEGAAIFNSGSLSKVVTSTQTQWYSSTSAEVKANGSWSTTQPTIAAGRYIWERQYITYSNGDTEYKPSEAGVCIQGQTDLSSVAPKTLAISRTQQIYYRTNTALTGSITGPTTWITKNDNGFNTTAPTTAITGWSTKPTPLATGTTENTTKYLYLYTCIQTQTVEQSANNGTTCTASTVLLDDTETIIDGSKIITGTVSANSINANSGTFNTANIPNLNAEKITSGDIAADRIKTNVIDAVNFSTDKIDADRISVSEISISDLAGEIGGRNLHKESETLAGSWTLQQATLSNGVATIAPTSNADRRIYQLPANGYWTWTNGVEYTASIEARSDNGATLKIYPYGATAENEAFTVTTDWKRYSFTFMTTNQTGNTGSMTYAISETSGKTLQLRRPKLEKGNKATDWTPAPEDVDSAIDDASKIASNYIHADSTGINIYDNSLTNGNKYYLRQTAGGTYIYRNSYLKAKYEDTITLYGGSNESGANPKVELTSSNFKMTDGGGIQRLLLDSTDGVIIGRPDKGRIQITDVGVFIYDTNSRRRTQIDSDGLHLYDTDGSTESAIFSPTSARIGKENNVAFYVNSDSLQAYYMNGSTRTKYFEVTPNGMSFGTNTVASQSYVTSQGYQTATQVTGLIDANQNVIDAKKHTQVLISAANVDYSATGNTTAATFTARLYIDGTVQTSTSLKWLWYKDGTVQGSVQTAANGTLTVTGSMGLDHRYSCRCEF